MRWLMPNGAEVLAGLDSEEGSRVQIGLALIETRLQAINLPKDAAET